jgi:hypothetical protein
MKQLPASAMPHDEAHRCSAIATQFESHENEQHSGSWAHTVSQQYASLQNGCS